METLREICLLLLCSIAITLSGQDQLSLQQAFAKSYSLESAGDYRGAVAAIKEISARPTYESELRKAWLYYLAGEYADAKASYAQCMMLMPAAVEPMWGLLNVLAATEDWQGVERTYKSIISLDPKNSLAHYRLGSIYYYRQDYATARQYLDVSLNLYPFDYDIALLSAWNHYYLGNLKEAKLLFNKVLLIRPDDESATSGLALLK